MNYAQNANIRKKSHFGLVRKRTTKDIFDVFISITPSSPLKSRNPAKIDYKTNDDMLLMQKVIFRGFSEFKLKLFFALFCCLALIEDIEVR